MIMIMIVDAIMFKKLLKKFIVFFICVIFQTHSWAFNSYSTLELDELEKEFIAYINQSDKIIRTPLAKQYIQNLGKKLAQAAPMPLPDFFLVKSIEINAFAGPGGHIGINSQLILVTANESELAAVMAHEMAHERLHHLYRMIQHEKQMKVPMIASILASMALGMINPSLGTGAMAASLTGFAQDGINFTRANEKESDRIGIKMLHKAGFDVRGMANFFRKMQANSRYYYTANIPAILRTHPLDDDRIAEAENRAANLKKIHETQSSPAYDLFKEMIRNESIADNKALLDYYSLACYKHNTKTACDYGKTLALLKSHQLAPAKQALEFLIAADPNNMVYQMTHAQILSASNHHQEALALLEHLHKQYPDNYPVVMAYADALLAAQHYTQAANILLKGFRHFKHDLSICETLAQAQAASKQKGFAYLTQSQCYLLQGRHIDALRQLRQAKKLAKGNPYLMARAKAMIEEIRQRP